MKAKILVNNTVIEVDGTPEEIAKYTKEVAGIKASEAEVEEKKKIEKQLSEILEKVKTPTIPISVPHVAPHDPWKLGDGVWPTKYNPPHWGYEIWCGPGKSPPTSTFILDESSLPTFNAITQDDRGLMVKEM